MSKAIHGPSVLDRGFRHERRWHRSGHRGGAPAAQQSENPVVVNISSALGLFWATHEQFRPAYKFVSIVYGSSKAAVSMLTVQYAHAHPAIRFNTAEPGITATELGGGEPGSNPAGQPPRARGSSQGSP
jgi:NAD(P)-dependent dehydrogenase (short-subunit alcohol dehydrogenase family)